VQIKKDFFDKRKIDAAKNWLYDIWGLFKAMEIDGLKLRD
jgi:hypothetical protein